MNQEERKLRNLPLKKEAEGTFKYDADTKRTHRYLISSDSGMVGTVYFPKGSQIPERLILERLEHSIG